MMWFLLLLLFMLQHHAWDAEALVAFGIPGTTQTINGYDREKGTDAICWKSHSAEKGIPMSNPLIEDFIVSFDGVEIQDECPMGNNISGTAPDEHVIHGEILRTNREYNYTIYLDINMTSLRASAGFTSDKGPGFVAVQVFSCVAGTSGFCSPFVHEQAIARFRASFAQAAAAAASANTPVANSGTGDGSGGGSSSGGGGGTGNTGSSGATKKKKWTYIRGTIHGGTHIHSGDVYVNLPIEEGPVFENVRIEISQLALVPGDYVSIAAAQFYFWGDTETGEEPLLYRYDMANILRGRQSLVRYEAPPDILEVDDGIVLFSYALIGAASLVIFFLLVQVVRHRAKQVIKLSQGSFLVVFLAAALIATATSFLMDPKNDFYCRASTPITMISLQLFYAVLAGRLWRIHALISPMLLKSLAQQNTPWTRFVEFVKKTTHRCVKIDHAPRKFRTQVTENQLSILVAVLVAPQILIQVLALLLQPRCRAIDFNEDESTGRAMCKTKDDLSTGEDIVNYGYLLFVLLIIGLLMMAVQSRKLPSLFNESKTIFDSTLTSFIIMVMGMAVILVTQEPTTSPAVSYLVWVFAILSMTVNTSLRIVWPKLRMVWRGETVIVSQLVLDHAKQVRKSQMRSSVDSSVNDGTGHVNIYDSTSLANNNGLTKTTGRSNTDGSIDLDVDQTASDETQQKSSELGVSEASEDSSMFTDDVRASVASSPAIRSRATTSALAVAAERYEEGTKQSSPPATTATTTTTTTAKKKGEIVIDQDKAPSRRLLLKMVDLQEQLNLVTQSIMSGKAVSQGDWEQTRSLTGRVGNIFKDDVTFAWERRIDEGDEEESNVMVREQVDI